MSAYNPLTDYSRISPYTLEEFNKLLEDNKPYTKEYFNSISSSPIITLENTTLDYLVDLKILICSKHKDFLNPSFNIILKHFIVSILFFKLYYLY